MNLSKKLGIDMGSSSMVVYVKGDGVVLNEPSLIATDEHGMRVLALGTAALQMVRRGDGAVTALRPVRDGDVIDQRVAGLALQHFVARVCGRQRIFRPDLMLSIPSTVTGVQRRAVLEAVMRAGAKTAYLIEKPLAAAIGAGLPMATSAGLAVCHLGAGRTEAAVLAEGARVRAADRRHADGRRRAAPWPCRFPGPPDQCPGAGRHQSPGECGRGRRPRPGEFPFAQRRATL